MKFSILIASIDERAEQLESLYRKLETQIFHYNLVNNIEIVVATDNKILPVGLKRNALIHAAKGDYVAFVDDDDEVSDNYVIRIHEALTKYPDLDDIGIVGQIRGDGFSKPFIHSITYDSYFEDSNAFYRPPNHLNPIRRDIVKKFPFPIKNVGEDTDFAMRMCRAKVLTKEHMIKDEILYFYNFSWATTATQSRR